MPSSSPDPRAGHTTALPVVDSVEFSTVLQIHLRESVRLKLLSGPTELKGYFRGIFPTDIDLKTLDGVWSESTENRSRPKDS